MTLANVLMFCTGLFIGWIGYEVFTAPQREDD